MAEAYIVAAARTAGGRKGGRLSGIHPADLAGQVIDSLIDRSGADPALVDDVVMGCVMQLASRRPMWRATPSSPPGFRKACLAPPSTANAAHRNRPSTSPPRR